MKALLCFQGVCWRAVPMSILLSLGTATVLAGPSISVSAFPTKITNEGQEATFTLSLSSPASRRIGVHIFMTGTAANGSDYVLIGNFNKDGQAIINAGQSSATITLHSFSQDFDPTPTETAILNILGGNRYQIGFPSRAQVAIQNLK
jgi:hypothetical protein